MALSNTQTQYGSITKTFHWLTAALILAIIPLGAIANKLPYETNAQLAQKAYLFSLHKTLGVAVFFVALLRILWAISQVKPGNLHPDRKGETLLAEVVHWLLYGSLVIAPLTGWTHHAATTGFAPIWWPFGQDLPLIPKNEALAHRLGSLHWIMTKVMVASLLLHIAGALKHVFIDKDATLRRMWFGTSDVPKVAAHRSPLSAPLAAAAIFLVVGGATLATDQGRAEGPAIAKLAQADSNWEVENGTLSITVLQLGAEVTGTFSEWSADITFDPANQSGEVTVTIAIGSLSLGSVTDQAMGADFFNVNDFPTATFAGPIRNDGGATYVSDGRLAIKGASVPVQFAFDLIETDGVWQMDGVAAVDRLDFNIGESMPDESNLGFTVEINADLTATQSE
jgi:cytochrome b561/polyisoprenoid-binding protein YceI